MFSENYNLDNFVPYNLPLYASSPMRQVPNDLLLEMFEDPAMKSVLKWRSKIATANVASAGQDPTDRTLESHINMTTSRGSTIRSSFRNNLSSYSPLKDYTNIAMKVAPAIQITKLDVQQTPLSRKRSLSDASEEDFIPKRICSSFNQKSFPLLKSTLGPDSPLDLFQRPCITDTTDATWTSAIDSLNNLESELQHQCYRNCAMEYGHLCGAMTPRNVQVDMRS